jgi:hypothetical protein
VTITVTITVTDDYGDRLRDYGDAPVFTFFDYGDAPRLRDYGITVTGLR